MDNHPPEIDTRAPRMPVAELEQLGEEIAELSAHLEAATARLLSLIREFDAQGGWTGFRSCAAWLGWKVGLNPGAAREKVRVARALGALPQIAAALGRGELSYAKVRALTRIATPETETRLLALGQAGTTGVAAGKPGGRSGGSDPPVPEPGAHGVSRRRRHGGHPGAVGAGGGGPAAARAGSRA